MPTDFTRLELTAEFLAEGISVGDVNGDGNLDVVYGHTWFEGPSFEDRTQIYPGGAVDPLEYSDNFFSYAHDLDSDDDLDVLVIGLPGRAARWYENSDDVGGAWIEHDTSVIVDGESPDFLDVDGDRQPDILCANEGRYGFVAVNWGAPTEPWSFVPVTGVVDAGRFSHGLGLGDVNADGRPDLLLPDSWYEAKEGLWTRHEASFGQGGAQMYAYDFDGDGDNDVAATLAAHEWGVSWFENLDGAGGSFMEHPIVRSRDESLPGDVVFSQPHALALADINGDGVQDLISGKRYWAHGPTGDPEPNAPAVTYWFETVRRDGAVEFVPHLLADDVGVGVMVLAVDATGDGLIDVVVGNKKGAFILHR